MKRMVTGVNCIMLLLLFASNAVATKVACDVINEKEAVALVGGALGEIFKAEVLPTAENGYDHSTVCGFFPKGYDIQKADRPPERGIQLHLHVFKTKTTAKTFYEQSAEMDKEMSTQEGSPTKGAKIIPVAGIGQAAYLTESKNEPEPGSSYSVTNSAFLKGNAVGFVMGWKKGASPTSQVKDALKKVSSKLP
jgi:hypothetical protein